MMSDNSDIQCLSKNGSMLTKFLLHHAGNSVKFPLFEHIIKFYFLEFFLK